MSQPSGRRLKIASFYRQEKIPLSTPVLVSFSTTASAILFFLQQLQEFYVFW
jgi:hypothetical protein